MEEGISAKKTIFVGNLDEAVTANNLFETFSIFGDIIDVQLPSAATNPNLVQESKHRGYGFVTFSNQADALDAIDNMDMNEFHGKVVKINLAKPQKLTGQGLGNRAIWESEDWLKQFAKPLDQSGGKGARAATLGDGEGGTSKGEEAAEDAE